MHTIKIANILIMLRPENITTITRMIFACMAKNLKMKATLPTYADDCAANDGDYTGYNDDDNNNADNNDGNSDDAHYDVDNDEHVKVQKCGARRRVVEEKKEQQRHEVFWSCNAANLGNQR